MDFGNLLKEKVLNMGYERKEKKKKDLTMIKN